MASLGIYDGEELSAPTVAHAQAVANPQKVTFTVTDGSGKGVRDARVSVYTKGRPEPVFTDAASEPVASELLPGEYTLRAGAPGYLEADIPFTVEEGKEAGVDIELAPATIGETGWISYDSGNADAALTTLAGGKTAAVRFDAGQGGHVRGARFYIFRSGTARDFEWALWERDDRDGLPGRMLVGPVKAHVEAGEGGGWVEVNTPYPIPVHGSYCLSYTQLDDGKDRISLGMDSRTDGSERSFKLVNDAW